MKKKMTHEKLLSDFRQCNKNTNVKKQPIRRATRARKLRMMKAVMYWERYNGWFDIAKKLKTGMKKIKQGHEN